MSKDKLSLSKLFGTGGGQFLGAPKALLASIRDNIGLGGRYWRFGEQDNFPNIIIDSANDSGTARDCIDKLHVFTLGKGLKNEVFAESKANDGQTWEQLDDEISLQLAYMPGVAIRVIYNAGGQPVKFYSLPIQNVRRRHDGQFIFGEELGDPAGYKMFNGWRREIIPAYGTNKTPQEIRAMIAKQRVEYGKQLGELLYVYTPGVGLNYKYYPVPKWSAGLHDINADAALSLHEESQVSNSFKGTIVIETRPLDRLQKDDDDLTEAQRFEDMIEAASQPDGGNVIHLETLGSDGEGSKITPLNIQHQMDATEKATDRVAKKVARLFGVPSILISIETAGKLGNNQELVNYLKLFNLTLQRKWKLKKRIYTTLFPDLPAEGFETKPLELFDFLPDELLKRLDLETLKKVFNLEGAEEEVAQEQDGEKPKAAEVNEHIKNLTGKQQQHLDRIVRKFNKEELTEAQAVLQLTAGVGFTEDEARLYLDIKEDGDDFSE